MICTGDGAAFVGGILGLAGFGIGIGYGYGRLWEGVEMDDLRISLRSGPARTLGLVISVRF